MQAAQSGILGLAISLCFNPGRELRWDTAEAVCPDLIRRLMAIPVPPGVCHNINIPDVAPSEVKGVRVVPQGRWGKLHEIRAAALFLASSGASYVTGSAVAVDGGWTAS
jgi:broad specificity polyphosphatase/5'/3'-nucleotidase SurE